MIKVELNKLLHVGYEGNYGQMQKVKKELSSKREAADERLVKKKKIRMDKRVQFKRKVNKKQH